MMHGHTNIKCFFWFSLHEIRRTVEVNSVQRDDAQLYSAWLDFCVSDITTRLNAGYRMWISDIKCTFNFIDFSENKSIKSSKCVTSISNPNTRTYRPTNLVLHTHTFTRAWCTYIAGQPRQWASGYANLHVLLGNKDSASLSKTMGLVGSLFM